MKKEEVKEKNISTSILSILEDRYDEYGRIQGVIYVSKEELEEYYEWRISLLVGNSLSGLPQYLQRIQLKKFRQSIRAHYNFDFLGCKIEIDPAILRDAKLSELGLLD